MASLVTDSAFVLFEDEVPAHQDLRVVARAPGVDLSIRPGSARHIGVEVVTPSGEVEESAAERLLERLNVSLTEENETVILETASPFQSSIGEWRALELPVQVRLSIPNDLNVEAQCSGGTMEVLALKGTFHLVTSGGSLRVEDVEGPLNIQSRSSSVRLRYCTGDEVEVEASAGALECHALEADIIRLRLRTCEASLQRTSGALSIETSHGALDVHTLDGKLDIQARRTPLLLTYEQALPTVVYASAADVALHVHADDAAALHLTGARVRLSDRLPFLGEAEDQLIEGRMGEDGPLIYVASFGGGVSVEPAE